MITIIFLFFFNKNPSRFPRESYCDIIYGDNLVLSLSPSLRTHQVCFNIDERQTESSAGDGWDSGETEVC